MFDKLAGIYDLIYRQRRKDYAGEAVRLTQLVRSHNPDATSLLDVACGTGEHLLALREHFPDVEGVELAPGMIAITQAKLPGVVVHAVDMADFDLGRKFGVVVCLFGSIGYMRSAEDLKRSISCMAGHLEPDGVLMIEPWWFKDQYIDGYVSNDIVRDGDRTVARLSRTVREGKTSRMDIHCVVADPDGIEHFTETHYHTPFTPDEYLAAFAAAGCPAQHHPDPPFMNGLFVGVRTNP